MDPSERTSLLVDAAMRPRGDEVLLSIREMLELWGGQRRGYWYVQQIKSDLAQHQLVAVPPFDEGSIDQVVRLVPESRLDEPLDATASLDEQEAVAAEDRAVRRSQLRPPESQETVASQMSGSITLGDLVDPKLPMASVGPEASMDRARSTLLRHDVEFLPVIVNARTFHGVVTWESIAKTTMHNPDAQLKDCIVPADIVDAGADLLNNIPRIIDRGVVFLRMPDKTIGGMVTVRDLARIFERMAAPFLLLGVAERLLRDVAEINFSPDEIAAAVRGTAKGADRPVDDLTFGELASLFERPDRWANLQWRIDRAVFLDMLSSVRIFRNEIMHFSSEEPSAERIKEVSNLIAWLRLINP